MNVLCSDDSLREILRSTAEDEAYRITTEHVDQCPHCQQRIAELAAAADDWIETRELLLESDREETDYSLRPWSQHSGHPRSNSWNASMASQLLSPPSHPEMLGRIGRYDVERLIGNGGMGVVFKAFDTELNRPVAIKVLAPHLAGNGAARQRFSREARAAAAVVHEHVVAIHNVESGDDQTGKGTVLAAPFLVMQHVGGESLQQRIDAEGPLEVRKVLRIGMQTASGLAAAHAQGLVHRDVKPSNILLEQGIERALLTDFGLARASDDASLTNTGFHPGTPQYMSPEQVRGESIDERSDLFSLGSVLYTMCTGRPPFRAETSYAILRRIVETEPRSIREINPDIPDWLESVIMRLLAKTPADRFDSAQQVAELLRQCLAHVQHPTTQQLPPECGRVQHPGKRSLHRWLVGAIAILVLAALVFAVSGPSDTGRNARPADSSFGNSSPAVVEKTATASELAAAQGSPAEALWDSESDSLESLEQDLADFQFRVNESWDALSETDQEKER